MLSFFSDPFPNLIVLQSMVKMLKKYVTKYGQYVNVLHIELVFSVEEEFLKLLSPGLANVWLFFVTTTLQISWEIRLWIFISTFFKPLWFQVRELILGQPNAEACQRIASYFRNVSVVRLKFDVDDGEVNNYVERAVQSMQAFVNGGKLRTATFAFSGSCSIRMWKFGPKWLVCDVKYLGSNSGSCLCWVLNKQINSQYFLKPLLF